MHPHHPFGRQQRLRHATIATHRLGGLLLTRFGRDLDRWIEERKKLGFDDELLRGMTMARAAAARNLAALAMAERLTDKAATVAAAAVAGAKKPPPPPPSK
ncbi:hypothetical protein BH10ACT5_BH10ACT5_21620 [soil metagenome]